MFLETGALRLVGLYSDYWSLLAFSSSLYAYHLYFDGIRVGLSSDGAWWFGLTVQARGS